jgi:hypothetical protein
MGETREHGRKKSWCDLSARQRRLIVAGGVIEIGLATAAWWDLAHRPASQVRGPKWCWALVVAVNGVGPVAYFAVGRRRTGPPSVSAEAAAGASGR